MIDPENVTREGMKKVKIPSAKPLVYTFREWRGGREERKKEVAGRLVRLDRNGNDFLQNDMMKNFGQGLFGLNNESKSDFEEDKGLDGYCVENEEIVDLSFCSKLGSETGEQDIA